MMDSHTVNNPAIITVAVFTCQRRISAHPEGHLATMTLTLVLAFKVVRW